MEDKKTELLYCATLNFSEHVKSRLTQEFRRLSNLPQNDEKRMKILELEEHDMSSLWRSRDFLKKLVVDVENPLSTLFNGTRFRRNIK